MRPGTGALACSMLSFSGCIFLFIVGILVKVQPQYMKIGKNVEGPASVFETGKREPRSYCDVSSA